MPEENIQSEASQAENPTPSVKTESPAPASLQKKGGKWFKKIPKDILFSPGGALLIFLALLMEAIDLIPGLGVDTLTWELAMEGIFMVFLVIITKMPIQGMIIPFIIERVPGISDICPTWLIRLFL